MKLRIIAGRHGGRLIDAPPTRKTHPMSERARNALFNSLADDIHGATVLDAFAGSGALGLEALSRGARSAVFVEKERVAAKVIAESIASLNLESRAAVTKAAVGAWLKTNPDLRFKLIFADPPYHDLQHATIRALSGRLIEGGIFVLSWPEAEKPLSLDGLELYRARTYAGAQILFYHRAP